MVLIKANHPFLFLIMHIVCQKIKDTAVQPDHLFELTYLYTVIYSN